MGVDKARRERYETNFAEGSLCVDVCLLAAAAISLWQPMVSTGVPTSIPACDLPLLLLRPHLSLFLAHATAQRPLHLHVVTARPRVLAYLRLPPGAFVSNSLIGIDYCPHAPAASHSFRPLQHAPASLVELIQQHSYHIHSRHETPRARPDIAATAQHSTAQSHSDSCSSTPFARRSRWYRTRDLRFGYSYREYRRTP